LRFGAAGKIDAAARGTGYAFEYTGAVAEIV
jgi:hypothetical protein